MATNVTLRKLLHRKSWEMCTPSTSALSASNTANGSFVASDKFNIIPNSLCFFVNGASGIYRYDGDEDSWVQLPNSGIAGTFGAGSCGELRGLGAMGGAFIQTCTAGGTASITTAKTIVRQLTGCRIRVIAGTGVGFDGRVSYNTIGANAIIYTSGSTTYDATTQFQVYSGSLWFFNAGSGAVGFSVYDLATNAWTAKSVTNLPTTFGTDGRLVSTSGCSAYFATGTATAGASTTLTNSAKSWVVNMWANYQVRIVSGTGAGQIRTIASNTATVLTVSSSWTVNPDATSVYKIEGNDDFFYLLGNNAVTLYKYVVSTNTWATLTPASARAAAAGAGCSASWITNASWTLTAADVPTLLYPSASGYGQNGRYIFSFRGGASSAIDVYDIAGNTWISTISYGNQNETFTTGTTSCDDGQNIVS